MVKFLPPYSPTARRETVIDIYPLSPIIPQLSSPSNSEMSAVLREKTLKTVDLFAKINSVEVTESANVKKLNFFDKPVSIQKFGEYDDMTQKTNSSSDNLGLEMDFESLKKMGNDDSTKSTDRGTSESLNSVSSSHSFYDRYSVPQEEMMLSNFSFETHDTLTGKNCKEEGTEVTLSSISQKFLFHIQCQGTVCDSVVPLPKVGSNLQSQPQKKLIASFDSETTGKKTSRSNWSMPICASINDVDDAHDMIDISMNLVQSKLENNQNELFASCCIPTCTDESYGQDGQLTIENSILTLLGGNSAWCNGWHAWSVHVNSTNLVIPESITKGDALRRVIRNRAGNLNQRTQRIRELQENMEAGRNLQDRLSHNVRRTCSFGGRSGTANLSGEFTRLRALTAPSQNVSVRSILASVNCGDVTTLTKDEINMISTNKDLCYDSDPELVINRGTAKSRRFADLIRRRADDTDFIIDDLHGDLKKTEHRRKKSNRIQVLERKLVDDEDAIARNMSEIMNMRMNLIWHPTPETHGENISPVSVKAWVELGHQLRYTLIQPKFMWLKKHDSTENMRETGALITYRDSVDLLDICRILDISCVDREVYPFAKRKTSFMIETFNRKMLFEASNEGERNRIVHGLKIIVAKLGSKIIVNDDSVFDDFFTSASCPAGESSLIANLV